MTRLGLNGLFIDLRYPRGFPDEGDPLPRCTLDGCDRQRLSMGVDSFRICQECPRVGSVDDRLDRLKTYAYDVENPQAEA